MRIAIIGTGISGLTAAHRLHPRHDLTVYEADHRVGGHANTVPIHLDDGHWNVDTGFIVYNHRNYPTFTRLLSELRVPTQPSDMSLAIVDERHGLEWGTNVSRLFSQRRRLADPRFLDPTLEPNDRRPGWCYLGNPETANNGPAGLARFTTLRAWLSQWSPDHSRADAEACIKTVTVPLLVVENSADDAVPTAHPRCVFDAATTKDKTYHRINGATHYYKDQPTHQSYAVNLMTQWLQNRRF